MSKSRALLAVGVVMALAVAANIILTSPPAVDTAPLLAVADRYDARIIRDEYGVPHIYGERDRDVAFGLAYAHAEDDFETIQDVVLATRGTLAAVRGPDAAKTDYLIRLMRVWPAIDAGYDSELSEAARQIAQAYADGINLFAARNPERVADFLLPVRGEDFVAGFTFKLPLFYGFDAAIGALFEGGARELAVAQPDPRSAQSNTGTNSDHNGQQLALQGERFLEFTDEPRAEIGSQGVAVAPHRTGDGKTRLLVNSHQPLTGPVAWYEARLVSGEGWDVAGATFPGSPVILHGHNRDLGWSSTVNKPDLVDVYQLTLNPENDKEYLLDGEWVPLEEQSADILVSLFGPLRWTFSEPLYFSAHGPVLKLDHGTFAIRWSGMGEVRTLDQYLAINKARSMGEFEAALAMGTQPSINQVYADREGNIAHYYNAMFPRRVEGWDWRKDLPGDRSELIWDDYLPFSTNPATRNPPSGFVFNANNTPFVSSVGPGQPQPESFSNTLGIETQLTNRALRLRRLLDATPAVDAQAFQRIKYDLFYDEDHEPIARLRAFLDAGPDAIPANLRDAFELLKSWDYGTQATSTSAALATLTLEALIDSRKRRDNVDLAAELTKARDYLLTHFERIDPPYGEVVRHVRGDESWPLDGGPDILRAVYTSADEDTGVRKNVAGDSYIMFIEWDENGAVSSRSIHNFGSATLDESSPHYADQAPLFATMRDRKVWLELDELLAHASRDYRP